MQKINYEKMLQKIETEKTRRNVEEIIKLDIRNIDFYRKRNHPCKDMKTIHAIDVHKDIHYAVWPSKIELHADNIYYNEMFKDIFEDFQKNLDEKLGSISSIIIPYDRKVNRQLRFKYPKDIDSSILASEFKILFETTYPTIKCELEKLDL